MKCPACQSPELVMSERKGVEIDYCPQCRGVWLDRGELDKIIDRALREEVVSAAPPPPPPPPQAPPPQPGYAAPPPHYPPPHTMHDSDYGKYSYKRKKRKHWLKELFD